MFISPKPLLSITVLVLSLSTLCNAQLTISHPDSLHLPANIQYQGQIVNTAQWPDKLGDNLVILTETGIRESDTPNDNGNRSAALYALHYLLSKDSLQLAWKVYDFINDCPVDLQAAFVKNTFAVTDLNHNGVAEIWMMYKVTCQGDVSPVPMKIIMYEGKQKYAARGNTKVKVSATEYMGGGYVFDDAFKTGPAIFRQYADALWQKHKAETWQ